MSEIQTEEKGITIIDKVKEVASKSGVAFELDITQVVSLAERGKAITSVNDPNFLPVKKEMQLTRKYVTEYFMDARSEFNKLAKGVIEVEKTVLAEFTPEENRLIALDKAEKERLITEARIAALPAKRGRITISGIEFTDEEMLAMSDADFEIEYNVRLGAKLEADRIADQARREAEQAKLDEERIALQREKDAAEAVEKARAEERERAAEELQITKEAAIREVKEASERAEREKKESEERLKAQEQERVLKAEREKKESEERAERERIDREKKEADRIANEKFQAFLTKNKYDIATDMIVGEKIYRLIAEFKA